MDVYFIDFYFEQPLLFPIYSREVKSFCLLFDFKEHSLLLWLFVIKFRWLFCGLKTIELPGIIVLLLSISIWLGFTNVFLLASLRRADL